MMVLRGASCSLPLRPNHMARDCAVIDEPNLFVRAAEGCAAYGRDPYSGDWTDTAQLNYWSEEGRRWALQQLFSLAERCDGLRVDMAMLCVNEVVERNSLGGEDVGKYEAIRLEINENRLNRLRIGS